MTDYKNVNSRIDYPEITSRLQYDLYHSRVADIEDLTGYEEETTLLKQLIANYSTSQETNFVTYLVGYYDIKELFNLYENGNINCKIYKECLTYFKRI